MSARIVLRCDQDNQYGTCVEQLLTDAPSIADARSDGEQLGWHYSPRTRRDLCPHHSGQRWAGRNPVVYLRSEDGAQ